MVNTKPSAENISPVTSDNHILGNPNADIMIVEFSDSECPFCENFHRTMNQVIEYRHNAVNSGGRGIPYSVIVTSSGKTFPFSGALPYEQIKALIEQAINSEL